MRQIMIGMTAAACLLSGVALAEKQPRWMSPEEGFIDPESQTEVTSVSKDSESGSYRIEIAVPKVEKPIEEVVVIGRKEEKEDPSWLRFTPDYEVINDLDTGRSGIVVYLDKKRNFRLLINYDDGSQAEFPEPVGDISP